MQKDSEAYTAVFDYTDDEDVTQTLKSAHQAEMIYGLHNTGYGYGGGGTNGSSNYGNTANGDYGYYRKPAGLNGEVEHQTYKHVVPSWGGNSTHNAYDKKYGDPEPAQTGYYGGYGS